MALSAYNIKSKVEIEARRESDSGAGVIWPAGYVATYHSFGQAPAVSSESFSCLSRYWGLP